jgi:hypothetical protein
MDTQKRNPFILIKNILRPIAVVHVPIDNQYPIYPSVQCPTGRQRNAVEQAKTHALVRSRMMPRRPYQTQRRPIHPIEHGLHGSATRPRRRQCHHTRFSANHGVGLEPAAPRLTQLLHALRHLRHVHPLNLTQFQGDTGRLRTPRDQPFRLQPCLYRADSFDTFRMGARIVTLKAGIVIQQGHYLAPWRFPSL